MVDFAFIIYSPTIEKWLTIMEARREELLNPVPQMTVLLDAVREDIDKQFDENQGSWTPLSEFTVEKKKAAGSDLRILHETKSGQGLRLRDAYKKAGEVTSDGQIIYTYPEEKPYAHEHQEGIPDKQTPDKTERRAKVKKKGLSYKIYNELKEFDREFKRKIKG